MRTLTDLASVAPSLRGGFTADFIGRKDGLPGFSRAYGLAFREVRPLLAAVKYQALASGDVDVIDGYSTDGLIARYDLVVLADDRRLLPPVPGGGAREPIARRDDPRAIATLAELSGRIDDSDDARPQSDARGRWRRGRRRRARGTGLVRLWCEHAPEPQPRRARTRAGRMSTWESFVHAIVDERGALGAGTLRHLLLSAVSLALRRLVAIPFGSCSGAPAARGRSRSCA